MKPKVRSITFFEREDGWAISKKIPAQHKLLEKIRAGEAIRKIRTSAFYYPSPVLAQAIVHQKRIIYNLEARKNVMPQKIAQTHPSPLFQNNNGPFRSTHYLLYSCCVRLVFSSI